MKPTRDELIERYATFGTDRLLEMLDHRDEYTPEAIEVLKAELTKRHVTESEIRHYVAAFGAKNIETTRKAGIPLMLWEKIFFFFIWFSPGFLSLAFGMNYLEEGLATKLRQSRFFRIAGFLFLLLIGYFSIMMGFGKIIGITLLVSLFGLTYWLEAIIYRK